MAGSAVPEAGDDETSRACADMLPGAIMTTPNSANTQADASDRTNERLGETVARRWRIDHLMEPVELSRGCHASGGSAGGLA